MQTFFQLLVAAVATLPTQASPATPEPQKQPPLRIGEIYIAGNTKTPSSEILKHVDLYPGELLTVAGLQVAEQRLAQSGLFTVSRRQGIRPTIRILERDEALDNAYRDLMIVVHERDE
jgi:hypothetical protein